MKKKISHMIFFVLASFVLSSPGFCLDAEGIASLNQAGIDGETIQVIIREKVIETCAFTVPEILDLKKSGMSNETIRTVVENASFMKDTKPVVYGQDTKPIKLTTVADIIELKNAGVSDEVIEALISETKDEDDEDRERAWQMLRNMGIIIDRR
jgi:hypothetical protein